MIVIIFQKEDHTSIKNHKMIKKRRQVLQNKPIKNH